MKEKRRDTTKKKREDEREMKREMKRGEKIFSKKVFQDPQTRQMN